MYPNTQKSRFSLSYIEAIASDVGYQVVEPRVDGDSVDGILMADFGRRPRIEFQAKATSRDLVTGANIHFPLSVKNYDELRADTLTPRILIVLLMPRDETQWLRQTDDELCLRHCAYWLSLINYPYSPNVSTVTVHVPTTKIFSSRGLSDLMQRTERGDTLC